MLIRGGDGDRTCARLTCSTLTFVISDFAIATCGILNVARLKVGILTFIHQCLKYLDCRALLRIDVVVVLHGGCRQVNAADGAGVLIQIINGIVPDQMKRGARHASACAADHNPDKVFECVAPQNVRVHKTRVVTRVPQGVAFYNGIIIRNHLVGRKCGEPIAMNMKSFTLTHHIRSGFWREGNAVPITQ